MSNRKVVLYIASSLDGYIAKPDDDLSFLNAIQREGEDYGYGNFYQEVDTVILGRRTYMWVKAQIDAFPHLDKEVYVVTRKHKADEGKVHYWPGSLKALVDDLKQQEGGTIFCDGGAAVANEMLRKHCIDEIILSIVPVILGDGIRLFHEGIPEVGLQLLSSKGFPSGLVQVHYKINHEQQG
jgi:dihydrofolate reductase